MSQVIQYKDFYPKIAKKVFIANGSYVIGQVELETQSSIWYNCVLRGDVGKIYIGSGSNIQDNTVIHVDRNYGDTLIGNMVTVGHGCILHACAIQDNVFIGMGSIVMDKVLMEKNSMLAAGSLVTKSKIIKSGELWAGRPARFLRKMSELEIEHIQESAENYISLALDYLGF